MIPSSGTPKRPRSAQFTSESVAERHREDDAERQPPRQFTGPNHVNLRRNSQYREARLECPHYRGCSLRIQAEFGS